jgi:hypothetical protein
MRRNYRSKEPREMRAKFRSLCAETSKLINKGDMCIYYPSSRQVFSVDSNQATEFRQMKQDDILNQF